MQKHIMALLVAQTLSFSAVADKHNNQAADKLDVEELAPAGASPVVNYHWTTDFQSSRNANRHASPGVNVTSSLVLPHTSPVNVMSTINTTLIFWGPSWSNSTFASDKITGLNYWYNNVQSSTYQGTVSEYTSLNHSFKTQIKDTSRSASSNPNAVLAEVCKLVGSSASANGYYPVYTDLKRGNANYCAWHSAGTCGSTPVQFAFFFSLDNDSGCDPNSPYAPPSGSFSAQKPGSIAGAATAYQQSQGLAALANVTAHELAEAASDPAYFPPNGYPYWGGYYDVSGSEIGDKCAWTFGPSNTGKSAGTVLIGAYDWKLQGVWSNNAEISGNGGYIANGLVGCITGS